jgi:hypothetical protein
VQTPEWEASLTSRVRAVVVPPEALPEASRLIARRPPAGRLKRVRRHRLIVTAPPFERELECQDDPAEAAEFARLVNVAALNAAQFAERRRAAAAEASRRVEEARSQWDARLEEARRQLEQAEAESGAIEEAQQRLAAVSQDTSALEERRSALERLLRDGGSR